MVPSLLQPQERGNSNPLGRTMSIETSPRNGPWAIYRDEDTVDIRTEQYRTHQNEGGLVGLTAHVAASVYVAPKAIIKDRAIVVGSVRLFDRAVIEDSAVVADSCTLRGDSSVGGEAILRGSVQLSHEARRRQRETQRRTATTALRPGEPRHTGWRHDRSVTIGTSSPPRATPRRARSGDSSLGGLFYVSRPSEGPISSLPPVAVTTRDDGRDMPLQPRD